MKTVKQIMITPNNRIEYISNLQTRSSSYIIFYLILPVFPSQKSNIPFNSPESL